MDNLTEIKNKLDLLYEEYQKKGHNLSDGKIKEVVLLLAKMTGNPNADTKIIAEQLSRFSAKICQMYFETLTKASKPSISVIDLLINDFLDAANKSKQPQHYVKKFADTLAPVIRSYKDEALASKSLPLLVTFIAKYAVNSKQSKEVFQNTINRTNGVMYLLDYSNVKKSLKNIWKITNTIFPELSKAKYESFIIEWGKKYGFIEDSAVEAPVKQDNSVKIEKVIVPNEVPAEVTKPKKVQAPAIDSKSVSVPNGVVTVSSETSGVASEKESPSEKAAKKLYISIKRDMDKEQESIITAFTDMIVPIGKAFESIQGEINKSREIGTENVSLKAKVADLERQLSEQRDIFQTVNHSLIAAKTENDELKSKISSLESQNSELDIKLNDAYAINSRESSLEAEKIRSELKKAFAFLYEDWLEYEFSDVSEENYESLQAIIKKVFRSLERNGIDFKGNN